MSSDLSPSHYDKPAEFPLVKIIIAVGILGIVISVATGPISRNNHLKRQQESARSCSANLKQIDAAKEQYAMDTHAKWGDTIPGDWSGLVGPTLYLKATPVCRSGGTYTIGAIGDDPTCSDSLPNYPHSVHFPNH